MSLSARVLEEKELIESRRKILKNARETFNEFLEKSNEEHVEDNLPFYRKTDSQNVVSILGGRGTGKTSITFTLLSMLYKENKDAYKIFEIIDPDRFDGESDALGWIIFSFQDEVNNISNQREEYCKETNERIELKSEYKELKEMYIRSKKDHMEKTSRASSSLYELSKNIEDITFANMKLVKKFKKFIRTFSKLYFNEKKGLLIFTFDDLDLSQEYGVEILKTINHYLKDQRIVSVVLGEKSVFKESCVINSLKKDNLTLDPSLAFSENKTLLEIRKGRANKFIEKILPKAYRFELKSLDFKEKSEFQVKDGEKISKLVDKKYSVNINVDLKIDKYETIEKFKYSYLSYTELPKFDYSDILNNYKNVRLRYAGVEDNIALIEKNLEFKEKKYWPMADVLPKTPRELGNFYELCQKIDIDNEIKISTGHIGKTQFSEISFKRINSIFKELKFYKNTIFNKIFYIDEISETIDFNFSNYELFVRDIQKFYWAKKSFEIGIKNIETGKLVEKKSSRIIQFAYDLCTTLGKVIFSKSVDIDFSTIKIYELEKLEIRLDNNLKTFRDYYLFRYLLEIYEPLIIRDMKNFRDQIGRLKTFIFEILKLLNKNLVNNEKQTKLKLLRSIIEIQKEDGIIFKNYLSKRQYKNLEIRLKSNKKSREAIILNLNELLAFSTVELERIVKRRLIEIAEDYKISVDETLNILKSLGIDVKKETDLLTVSDVLKIDEYFKQKTIEEQKIKDSNSKYFKEFLNLKFPNKNKDFYESIENNFSKILSKIETSTKIIEEEAVVDNAIIEPVEANDSITQNTDIESIEANDSITQNTDIEPVEANDSITQNTDIESIEVNDAITQNTDIESIEANDSITQNTDIEPVEANDSITQNTDIESIEVNDAITQNTDIESIEPNDSITQNTDIESVEANNAITQNTDIESTEVNDAITQNTDIESIEVNNAITQNTDIESIEVNNAITQNTDIESIEVNNAITQNTDIESIEVNNAITQNTDIESIEVNNAITQNTDIESIEVNNAITQNTDIESIEVNNAIVDNNILDGDNARVYEIKNCLGISYNELNNIFNLIGIEKTYHLKVLNKTELEELKTYLDNQGEN